MSAARRRIDAVGTGEGRGMRRAAPAPLTIAVAALFVVSAGVFLSALSGRWGDRREGGASLDSVDREWPAIQAAIPALEASAQRALARRTVDESVRFQSEVEARIAEVCALLERADRLLEPHRDPSSGEFPERYRPCQADLVPLVRCLGDLTHASTFGAPLIAEER